MSDLQGRGYLITATAAFLRENAGEDAWKGIHAGLSSELRQLLESEAKPAAWYPIGLLNELNRAIAHSLCAGDAARAQDAFIRCGKFAAREATNSFLRILLRILTPTLFAKKLPELFGRDFTRGKLIVEVTDKTLVGRMYDMHGFDYCSALGPGFASFPLEAMGKTVTNVTVHDWSLERPYVDGAGFELTWKD